jgi:hypothetical protein
MKRRWPNLCGLRVFELHESHGIHVHLITNRWVDVHEARTMARQAGWGRIHVQRIPIERAAYVAKYLSKDRPHCLRRWRLWAGFGKWDWTRVKDLVFDCRFSRIYRACKEWLGWQGRKQFFDRIRFVARMEFLTVCNGWIVGCGPGGRPYRESSWSYWDGTTYLTAQFSALSAHEYDQFEPSLPPPLLSLPIAENFPTLS